MTQEAKDPESTETSATETTVESREPDSDATSTETLADLEETEKVPEAEGDEGGSTATPSPDGAFDDPGTRGDAEPM